MNSELFLCIAAFLLRMRGDGVDNPALIGGTYLFLRLAVPGVCLNQMTPYGRLTEFGAAGVYSR